MVPEGFLYPVSKGLSSNSNSSETGIVETVTATATVKNQKTSHWFLCYKFVKKITVAQPSESPIKRSVKPASTKYCHVTQETRDNVNKVPILSCYGTVYKSWENANKIFG
jgi:hypothetical protein